MFKRLFVFIIAVLQLLALPAAAQASPAPQQAPDLTSSCEFTVSSNPKTFKNATDGKWATSWKSSASGKQWIEITADEPIQGISIEWKAAPSEWRLFVPDEDGNWKQVFIGYRRGFLKDYVQVFGSQTIVRLETTSSGALSVMELAVYGQGKLPTNVQTWEKAPRGTDLMVISTHPDDEVLYIGGTLPYYAGQRKLKTVVVYMTASNRLRSTEALNCLWTVGVRNYPVLNDFPDKLTQTLPQAKAVWGEEKTIQFIVNQIRKYRPKVIVTQDLNGEYGHGMHRLTAYATLKAVERSADPSYYPQSAAEFGTWKVLKCYLHLYPQNKVTMDWNLPLSAFGGKTALSMAAAGYDQHVSQHIWHFKVTDQGRNSCAQFGLAYTAVGPDKVKKDFFENIYPLRLVDNIK